METFLDNFSWKLFFMKLLFGKWKPFFLWKMETFFFAGKNQKKNRKNQQKKGYETFIWKMETFFFCGREFFLFFFVNGPYVFKSFKRTKICKK